MVTEEGWSQRGITPDALKKLSSAIRDSASVDDLSFKGLSRSRAPALPVGVAVLSAIFECLGIDEMHVSEGALREGLLNDLLGRFLHQDVRTATVESLMDRYHVDREQARRVERTLLGFLPQVAAAWNLPER